MARVRAVVRGLVQGVCFRACTEHEARRLGLSGWVRNQRDGTVALEAQGDEEAVQELLDWCSEGPAGARVSGVESEWVAETKEHGFEIRR